MRNVTYVLAEVDGELAHLAGLGLHLRIFLLVHVFLALILGDHFLLVHALGVLHAGTLVEALLVLHLVHFLVVVTSLVEWLFFLLMEAHIKFESILSSYSLLYISTVLNSKIGHFN